VTKKPNFAKFVLGVTALALLFIATMAVTRAPRTTIAKGTVASNPKNNNSLNSAQPINLMPAAGDIDATFQVDGNSVVPAAPPPDDWDDVNPTTDPACDASTGNGVFTGPSNAYGHTSTAEISTFVVDTCANDQIYTQGGSKDFNDLGDWMHTTGSVPDKDEIVHAYAAKYAAPGSGDVILAFGGDRLAVNGDANIGFWFFQNAVAPVAGGTFSGNHAVNDIFVLSAFTGGGGTSTVRLLIWVGGASCPTCQAPYGNNALGYCQDTPAHGGLGGTIDIKSDTSAFPFGSLCEIAVGNNAKAVVNPDQNPATRAKDPITVGWPYTAKGGTTCATGPCPVQPGAFFEGAIDLTALVPGIANECLSSFLLETRSSQDVDAVLKDFALGSFNTCVSFECSKVAAPTSVCEGTPVNYTYTFHNTGAVPVTVDLVDDNGTPGNTSDDITIITGDPVAAQATNTYHRNGVVLPLGDTTNIGTFTVHSAFSDDTTCFDDAKVTVNPNPTAAAGNDQTTNCVSAATTPFTLAGTSTNGTGVWSVVSGPVAINSQSQTGNAVGASVTFTGTGTATLRLTTTSASCGTATDDVVLNVTPAVGVSINHLSECDLSGATTVTLTATPSGGTGPLTYKWSGGSSATTPSISAGPGTYTVEVTDANGCKATATRKIGLCSD
jgi:hypothetical protein